MSASQLNSSTRSYGLSLSIANVLSALLVVAKETNEGLLDFMKHVTMHHWVTHVLFFVGTFVILGFALHKSRDGQGPAISDAALLQAVIGSVVLSAVIIVTFYLLD